jgi:hypothetical protein
MPDLTDEMRCRVLDTLEGVHSAVLTARNSEKLPTGYQNFDLALTISSACRYSIERVRDREEIVAILRQTSRKLSLWASGRAEPAMKSAHRAIDEMVADLEQRSRSGG